MKLQLSALIARLSSQTKIATARAEKRDAATALVQSSLEEQQLAVSLHLCPRQQQARAQKLSERAIAIAKQPNARHVQQTLQLRRTTNYHRGEQANWRRNAKAIASHPRA